MELYKSRSKILLFLYNYRQFIRFTSMVFIPYIIVSWCRFLMLLQSEGMVKRGVFSIAAPIILLVLSLIGMCTRVMVLYNLHSSCTALRKEILSQKEENHGEFPYLIAGIFRDIRGNSSVYSPEASRNMCERTKRYVSEQHATLLIIEKAYISNLLKLMALYVMIIVAIIEGFRALGVVKLVSFSSYSSFISLGILLCQICWSCIDIKIMIDSKRVKERMEDPKRSEMGEFLTKHNIGVSVIATCCVLQASSVIINILSANGIIDMEFNLSKVILSVARIIGFIGMVTCLSYFYLYSQGESSQYQIGEGATMEGVIVMGQFENFDTVSLF